MPTTLSWADTFRLLGEARTTREVLSLPLADTVFLPGQPTPTRTSKRKSPVGLIGGEWATAASRFEPRALVARFLRASSSSGAPTPHPCAVEWSGESRARCRRELTAKAMRAILNDRGERAASASPVLQAWSGPVADAADGKRRLFQAVYVRASPSAPRRTFVRCVEVDDVAGVGAARRAPSELPPALAPLERVLTLATEQFARAVEIALASRQERAAAARRADADAAGAAAAATATWCVARLALEFAAGAAARLATPTSRGQEAAAERGGVASRRGDRTTSS